jgi:hypothetical protein
VFLYTRAGQPVRVEAAANSTINFQARLMTASGGIVADGTYNVEFKLYNASSSSGSSQGSCAGDAACQWTETRTGGNKVTVRAGYLTVNLGSVSSFPSTINWDQQLWLTMNIGGTGAASWDGEMSPRLQLTAVPFALRAGSLATYNSGTGFTSTLSILQPTGGNQTFQIPDQGAAGTYTLLTSTAANGAYIQNQNSGDQTADLRISGTARANTSVLTPLLDTASGVALNIGMTNATAINLNQNTTIASNKTLTVTAGATTLTGATGGSSTALTVNSGATTNIGAVVKAVASQTADLFQIQDSSGSVLTRISSGGVIGSGDQSAGSTNSGDTTIRSGNATGSSSNSGNLILDVGTATGTAGTISIGTSNTSGITIGRSGVATTFSSAQITNTGATLNTSLAISNKATGGDIGTAAATVDVKTTFDINQTTSGQTLTLPTPTSTTSGRIVYVNNVGTASFTMYGSVIASGKSNAFIWNGSSWVTTVSLSGSVVNSIGTIDSVTKSSDGASISGNAIYLQSADASAPGLVTTGAQTFGGNKTFNGSVLTSTLDVASAGTLSVGTSTATAISLGKSGITTTNNGALTVSQLLTGNLGATISGATINLNDSSNFATNINTGSSTGAVSIGNSAAGAISLQSASTIDLTGTTTITGRTTGDALTVNNATSTGNIFVAQDNGTAVLSVADGGAVTLRNSVNSTAAFRIQNAMGYENLVTVDTTGDPANLIANNDFENNVTGWSYSGTPGSIAQTTSQASFGSGSLVVTTTANANNGAKYNISLTPSTTYTLSWSSKLSSGSFTDIIAAYAVDGSTESNCTSITTQTVLISRWIHISCTITTSATMPSGTPYIVIKQTAGTARTFYIDNVKLEQAASQTNYYTGLTSLNSNLGINTPAISSTGLLLQSAYGANGLGIHSNGTNTIFNYLFDVQDVLGKDKILMNEGTNSTTISGGSPLYSTPALTVITESAAARALQLKAAVGQTSDLLRTIDSSGNGIARIGGTSALFGSVDQTAASTNSTDTTIRSGNATGATSNSGNLILDVGTATQTAGTISVGTANTSGITIGHTGVTTTNSGNLTVGASAGSGTTFTNNGATVNSVLAKSDFASGGSIGSAATTVDIYTAISIAQTTAGQTLTLPTPTASTTYGRVIYISNIGTASFTLAGSIILPGTTAALTWSNTNGGASWQYVGDSGGSGNYIQNQNSTTQTANFLISGTGQANTSFLTPTIDVASAGTLSLGTSTATAISLGKSGITTTNAGALTVSQLLTGNLGATVSGAAISLNDSSNFNTTINTGNSTGSVSIGNNTGNTAITIDSGTSAINIGTGAQARTTNIATGAAAQTVTVGSTNSSSVLALQGGSNGISFNTGGTSRAIFDSSNNLFLGNASVSGTAASPNNFTIQGTGSSTSGTAGANITLQGGTGNTTGAGGALNLQGGTGGSTGTGGAVNLTSGAGGATSGNSGALTIATGNTTSGTAGNISIDVGTSTSGNGSILIGTAARTQTITIGNTSSAFSSVTLAAGATGMVNLNTGQTQFSEVTGTRTFTVQTRTSNVAGSNLTVSAGTAGSGATGVAGGTLTLQGGGAAGATGNANGGDVIITGGAAVNSGYQGLVNLSSTAFTTAPVQTISSTGVQTITAGNQNIYSTLPITASVMGVIATLGDPGQSVIGRILYITARSDSQDFILRLNSTRTPIDITMKANSTATLIWNGTDWTAAGASSSTDLQAAYNNTVSSAGGAELVLNAPGGNADGLTIRNNATIPITGAELEVQTSIGSNLFSVNNNATEYASNGGAETAGSSSSTFPSSTWSASPNGGTTATISRDTTNGEYATGQASVKVVTTGATTANQGVANQLSAALTANLQYTVSFTVKGNSNFTTLDVYYSKDGTNTSTTSCSTGNTVKQTAFTRINCTFTAPSGGITSSNAIFIRQSDSNTTAQTFFVDNLSVTINASVDHSADGSVSNSGTFATNWVAVGGSVTRDTTNIYDTSGAVSVSVGTTANRGVYNFMGTNGITPTASASGVQYRASFYIKANTGTVTLSTSSVYYSPDGNTTKKNCYDLSTTSITTAAGYTLVSCIFTTDNTTASAPRFYITNTATTDFYVDALTITLNTNTANNVQIGGANKGGPITLLTLDRSYGTPIAANNDAYLGSMYFDTSTNSIQCYGTSGWGACGAAPDNIVNLNPEYAGAVMNGSGVGTMTADFCANQTGVLSVNTSFCNSGEARNFYRWTSPQASQQTYSIYVTYQLPPTFKSFASDNTVQLTGRVDDTTNAVVTYEMFKNQGGVITACGTETTVTTSTNTWQTVGINGNEATGAGGCSFNTSSAGSFVIFKINMKANSNANAYVSTLSFTTKGQ